MTREQMVSNSVSEITKPQTQQAALPAADISERLFARAGKTPDPFTHLLAAVVLERALNHHHGQRQRELYAEHKRESSPEVRAHWAASSLLNRALRGAMSEYERAKRLTFRFEGC